MEYSTNLISEESQHKHEQGLKDGIYGYTEKSEYFQQRMQDSTTPDDLKT